jgi:hypothetical protein
MPKEKTEKVDFYQPNQASHQSVILYRQTQHPKYITGNKVIVTRLTVKKPVRSAKKVVCQTEYTVSTLDYLR